MTKCLKLYHNKTAIILMDSGGNCFNTEALGHGEPGHSAAHRII